MKINVFLLINFEFLEIFAQFILIEDQLAFKSF